MLAWISKLPKLIGDVFRIDMGRAVGGLILTILFMAGFVFSLANSWSPFEQFSTVAGCGLLAGCVLLMTTDSPEKHDQRILNPRDLWNVTKGKVIGGGLIFCFAAIVTAIAVGAYFPISSDMLGVVIGGCVLGCMAYGAIVLLVKHAQRSAD